MNNIRVASGKYRGRKLMTPRAGTHPMGERERLALFNMIAEYLPGAKVLDAYAGSGALGIEALSRGALEVEFIEKNLQAAKVIRGNLRALDLDAKVTVADVVSFTTDKKFDVILVDPPYDVFEKKGTRHLVSFLKSGGLMVLSHPGEAPEILGLALQKSHKYAGATISIYVKDGS